MTKNAHILTFEESVRKRPGMFIGSTGSSGIVNMLKGLVSDCMEVTRSRSYLFHITVLPEKKFQLEVESSNNLKKFSETLIPENSILNNFHLKICNVLSDQFDLMSKADNKLLLTFTLDKTIFTESLDYWELAENFLQYAYLNRNTEIVLTDNRGSYLNQNYFSFPQGVKYLYDRMVKEALGKPEFEIFYDGVHNGINYQLFLGYRTDWYPPSYSASFANNVQTVCGGSLVDGIMKGLIAGCRHYVKSHELTDYKIKKKKFENGLILIASVQGRDFQYGGSFKETLEDETVERDVKKLMKQLTIDFITENRVKAEKFLWRFDETKFTSGMY
jgi:DNA gyrase/topoisomerase IV subunit B